jgi:hypothetical protein
MAQAAPSHRGQVLGKANVVRMKVQPQPEAVIEYTSFAS